MNQTFKTILLAFLAVLLSKNAVAVQGVGNGGNVIVCRDSSSEIYSVELLDYFELRQRGGQLKLNPSLGAYPAILKDLFERWKSVAPRRMAQYEHWLSDFETEALFSSGVQIPPTEDTGIINIPVGCDIVPVAYQRPDKELFPGVTRYTISKDLWDRLPEITKAGLVLHELIYREGIRAGHESSFPTRYFNGYLASATPDSMQYALLVQQMPLEWVEFGSGAVINLGTVKPFQTVSIITEDGFVAGKDYDPSCTYPSCNNQHGAYLGFFGDVSSEHLKIRFHFLSPTAANQPGQIEVTPKAIHLTNLANKDFESLMASIDGLHVEFNNLPFSLSSFELTNQYNHLQINMAVMVAQTPLQALDVNPTTSYYVQTDGSRIDSIAKILPRISLHFSSPEALSFGDGFVTSSGDTWIYDYSIRKYVKNK